MQISVWRSGPNLCCLKNKYEIVGDLFRRLMVVYKPPNSASEAQKKPPAVLVPQVVNHFIFINYQSILSCSSNNEYHQFWN